jgi:hypothetical protein
MIERMLTTRVANGYVVQIKLIGISTESTFVSKRPPELLVEDLDKFIKKVLDDKL